MTTTIRRTQVSFPDSAWEIEVLYSSRTPNVCINLFWGDKPTPTHTTFIPVKDIREIVFPEADEKLIASITTIMKTFHEARFVTSSKNPPGHPLSREFEARAILMAIKDYNHDSK